MAVFNPITITDNGKEMLTQALAGQGTLTFVSVSTSTSTPSNPEDLTTLTGIKQTVTPASAILDGNVIQVSALFSNSNLTQGYTANSLGLYAKLGDGAQTLFAVVTATDPDVFPAQNTQSPSSFLYQFNISISDTSQITIAVPEGGNLSAAVFYQTFPGLTPPTEENAGDMMVVEDNGEWGYVDSKNAIVQSTATGEFLSFETSLAIPMDNVLLYGKSTQYNTGANLFDINAAKSGNAGDITITDYGTGEFTVSTQNNVAFQGIALKDWCPTLKLGQFCTLSGATTSTDKCLRSAGGAVWNFGETRTISNEDLADTWYFVATTEVSTSGTIVYLEDTFSGVMVTYGSTVPPYEVYTAGTGEPSPDTPIPIISVGEYNEETEKYEVGIAVTGAQLFDASKIPTKSQGGATVTNNGDGSFTVSGSGALSSVFASVCNYSHRNTIKMLKCGKISLEQNGNTTPYALAQLVKKDNVSVYFRLTDTNNETIITKEMLEDEGCYLSIYIYGQTSQIIKEGTVKPMLYQSGDGTWETFKQQQTTLSLSEPLRGIPVDSGGNYTDETGQQWICDYIDREKGKYVQCVREVVFDGSDDENWFYQSDSYTFSISYLGGKGIENRACVCDKFISKQGINPQSVDYLCCGFNPMSIYSDYFYFKAVGEINFTLASDFKKWLSNNPTTIIYQLKSPIEIDLAPDQLAALNLSTYEGVTNIGTDSNAGIGAEYQAANFAADIAQKTFDLQSTAKSQAESIQALQNTTQTQGEDIQGLEERTGLLEEDLQTLDHIIGTPSTSSPVMIPVVTDDGKFTYAPLVDLVYKIGDIKQTTTNVNPGTYLGGTWIPWGTGRTPVGVDTDQTEFNAVEKTGGEITHTLTVSETPPHSHDVSGGACTTGNNGNHAHTYSAKVGPNQGFTLGSNGWPTVSSTAQNTSTNGNHNHSVPAHNHTVSNTGNGQAHNNLQPYITCYYWKRTA